MSTEQLIKNARIRLSFLLGAVAGVSVLLLLGLLSAGLTDTGDGGDAGAGGTAATGGVMAFVGVTALTYLASRVSLWLAAVLGPVLGFLAVAGVMAMSWNATASVLFLMASTVLGPLPLTIVAGLIAVTVDPSRRRARE